MKKSAIAVAAATLLFASGTAMAEQPATGTSPGAGSAGQQTQGQNGQGMDQPQGQTNQGAGSVTQGPPRSGQGQGFDDLDQNRDGMLDQDELDQYGSPAAGTDREDEGDRGDRNMQFYDENQDGSVSEDEFDTRNQQPSGTSGGGMGTGAGGTSGGAATGTGSQ